MTPPLHIRAEELAPALSEWDRRYRENPDAFEDAPTSASYGEKAAKYLLEIIDELRRFQRSTRK